MEKEIENIEFETIEKKKFEIKFSIIIIKGGERNLACHFELVPNQVVRSLPVQGLEELQKYRFIKIVDKNWKVYGILIQEFMRQKIKLIDSIIYTLPISIYSSDEDIELQIEEFVTSICKGEL